MKELPVAGGGVLPVGKIVCLGRNYAAHAEELGNDVPSEPVLFLKPATSLLPDGGTVLLPDVGRVDHEVELAVHMGKGGRNIPASEAMEHVFGYSVALDITARDVQSAAKRKGLPWTLAKGMDTFCPISKIRRAEDVPDPHSLRITLALNGETRQGSSTSLMLWRLPDIIAYVSRYMTFERGDIILTGTPEGVSPLLPGDRVHAEIPSVGALDVTVASLL